jgi:hypothetical protein
MAFFKIPFCSFEWDGISQKLNLTHAWFSFFINKRMSFKPGIGTAAKQAMDLNLKFVQTLNDSSKFSPPQTQRPVKRKRLSMI